MSEQLSLLERDDTKTAAKDRLFFGIFPDPETAASISVLAERLRSQHGLKGKSLKTERFHITLHHLGDYAGLPQGVVDAACKAAANVTMQPFEVAFDRAMSFSGRPTNRPYVLRADEGVTGLKTFRQALSVEMQNVGLGVWAKAPFTPHVTLLYDARLIAEQSIEPIAWTVREFVLVHSLIGQNLHVPLGRWPLRISVESPMRFPAPPINT